MANRKAGNSYVPESKFLNHGEEDQMEIYGYKKSSAKAAFSLVFVIVTLGIAALIFYWKPDWLLKCTSVRCLLQQADAVLLKDQWKDVFVEYISIENRDNIRVSKKKSEFKLLRGLNPRRPLISGPLTNAIEVSDPLSTEHIIKQRYFMNKKLKYLWDDVSKSYEKLKLPQLNCSYFHQTEGLSTEKSIERFWIYDENFIRIYLTPILVLIISEGLTPFYVFQVFSILLWTIGESYYYYAGCILVMSAISLAAQIFQQRSMERGLKKTVTAAGTCFVKRNNLKENKFMEISSVDLVPGDVIKISNEGGLLHCDAVLTSGTVIVNESMLTGESIPITKTAITPNKEIFNEKEHSRHILYCGTSILQTRSLPGQPVVALVIRTGFSTSKGSLIRSILFPKSIDFKFTKDSYKYVAALAGVALIGMIYTAYYLVAAGNETSTVVTRMFDIVTIVVPPALPAAMTYCIAIAQYRLKKRRIFCINSKSINICGSIDVFCFDKTGTLTEDGLDLYCIHPSENNKFLEPLYVYNDERKDTLEKVQTMRKVMATCHSLVLINGKLLGDPLDSKMFDFTECDFIEAQDGENELGALVIIKPKHSSEIERNSGKLGIIKQLAFSSKLQRMSVVVRQKGEEGDSFCAYAKGSPEMIASLSQPSTVPTNFEQVLIHYTQQGFRVLALAWKPIYGNIPRNNVAEILDNITSLSREDIESSLTFLGLVVLENRLKSETIPALEKLKLANIKTVMVTGDNILTAINVAQKSRFIDRGDQLYMISLQDCESQEKPNLLWCQIGEENDATKTEFDIVHPGSSQLHLTENNYRQTKYHFAITGRMWKLFCQHYPELLPNLVVRGTIFARFAPEQKQQLVEQLQAVGYYVGMCGDGANDCGALKTAHAGISLSEAEASVASPFTSKDANVSCVIRLVREGRCALSTSFGIFKLMAGYSMTQFLIACIFVRNDSFMSDLQYMYQDIFLLTPLSFTFCFTSSYKVLVARKPQISLVAVSPLLSLFTTLMLNLSTMIFAYYHSEKQPWFEDSDDDQYKQRNTCIFLISSTHIVTMSIIYSHGPPFQKMLYTNVAFLVNVVLASLGNYLSIMYSNDWWSNLMHFYMPPSYNYRAVILGVTVLHFFLCCLVEKFFINEFLPWFQSRFFSQTNLSKHEIIEKELLANENWPPTTKMNLNEFMEREGAANFEPQKKKAEDEEELGQGKTNLGFSHFEQNESDDLGQNTTTV